MVTCEYVVPALKSTPSSLISVLIKLVLISSRILGLQEYITPRKKNQFRKFAQGNILDGYWLKLFTAIIPSNLYMGYHTCFAYIGHKVGNRFILSLLLTFNGIKPLRNPNFELHQLVYIGTLGYRSVDIRLHCWLIFNHKGTHLVIFLNPLYFNPYAVPIQGKVRLLEFNQVCGSPFSDCHQP